MAFNPLGGYLVTGSSDCIGRIWRTLPMPLYDRSSNSEKSNSSNNGTTEENKELKNTLHRHQNDVNVEVNVSGPRTPERQLMLQLCGHTKEISDVLWSNRGDRLITASQMDGTVRVWSWNAAFTAVSHIVLIISSDSRRAQICLIQKVSGVAHVILAVVIRQLQRSNNVFT